MSLKMTEFTFVSCFISCFDNTGYRIVGILAETLAEKYRAHSAIFMNKGFGYGMEVKLIATYRHGFMYSYYIQRL